MNELALFAGIGGSILGGSLLGWITKCAVEINPYARQILLCRQQEGHLPRFPIWDDIQTFEGTPWKGHINVITGGFPCTDISSAGLRAGINGKSSSLFFDMARIIGEVRPQYAFLENSPDLKSRGLGQVLSTLSELGYLGSWCVLGGRHIGAPHRRDRLWILATDTNYQRERTKPIYEKMESSLIPTRCSSSYFAEALRSIKTWRGIDPKGLDAGSSYRMERNRSTGRLQIPAVAAIAFSILRYTQTGEV